MLTASIKFTQGGTTDLAGRALVGAVGTSVVVSNGDNTGVGWMKIEILDAPTGSAVSPGELTLAGSTASFTPNVSGTYQIRLTVKELSTDPDSAASVDVRDFIVANAMGLYVPALGSSSATFNYGGQTTGWKRALEALFAGVITMNTKLSSLWARTITAGNGLSGGGNLSADCTLAVRALDSTIAVASGGVSVGSLPWSKITTGLPTTLAGYGITDAATSGRTISTTAPLTGGGDLSTNRTFALSIGTANQALVTNSGATADVWQTLSIGATAPLSASNSGNVVQGTTLSIAAVNATTSGVAPAMGTASRVLLTSDGSTPSWGQVADAYISGVAWGKLSSIPTLTTTAPLTGGGTLGALTLSVADVSNASKGVVPTVGASGTLLQSNGTAAAWGTVPAASHTPGSAYQALVTNSGATAAAWQTLALSATGPIAVTNSGNIGQGTTISVGAVSSSAAGVVGASTGSAIYGTLVGNVPGWQTDPVCTSLSVSAQVNVGGQTVLFPGSLAFASAQSSVQIYQGLHATTPHTFTVQAGNVTTGTGSVLALTSGTGSVAPGSLQLQTGAVNRLVISPTAATWHLPTQSFDVNAGAPTITQATQATVGSLLTIKAADVTTGTGSGLAMSSGAGSAAAGNLALQTGGTTRITVTPTYHYLSPASGTGYVTMGPVSGSSTDGGVYLGISPGAEGGANYALRANATSAYINAPGTGGAVTLQINGLGAIYASNQGLINVRITTSAPLAAAPANTTVYSYVSGGEAACPAPLGAECVEDFSGAYWRASKRAVGLVNTATFTIDVARLPAPPSGTSAKFNTISGKLRIVIIDPIDTGSGTLAIKGHAEYGWDAFVNAGAAYGHVYLQTLFAGAVTTPSIAVASSVVTITVTGTSGLTADYMVICEGAATWR